MVIKKTAMTEKQFCNAAKYLRLTPRVVDMRIQLGDSGSALRKALDESPELEAKLILRLAANDSDLMGVIQEYACRCQDDGGSDKLYSAVLRHIKSTCESQEEKKCPPVAVPDTDNNQVLKQPQVEDKPGVQPIAGAKSTKKPFDFDAHIKAYEERRIKGEKDKARILSALTDERARDYVNLYFASVMWDIGKFRERLTYDIAAWTELYNKYGDTGIANYPQSIATAQTVLQALKAVKCE